MTMRHCITYTDKNTEDRKNVNTFNAEEVKKHRSVNSCWLIKGKNVYDVTDFLNKHPGGVDIILNQAGTNISGLFQHDFIHKHTARAHHVLNQFKIGELTGSSDGGDASLELRGWNEDVVDWNHGMVFQVHKYGTDYMKWVNSPVNKKLRLFDSEFIEYFSKTRWYMIPIVWLPVIFMLAISSINNLSLSMNKSQVSNFNNTVMVYVSFILFFLFGILLWTFAEYMLHRYLFHKIPDGNSPIQITIHFFFHGQHHKVPFDGERLVFPPAAASVFALLFWGVCELLFPPGIGSSILCGGLLGYVCYDLIHFYLHHGNPVKGSYFDAMKKYHVLHHFTDHEAGYGISSKFWDYVFKTLIKQVM